MTAPVVILLRTEAGRELLRLVLPAARSPDSPDGELPDGSSIFDIDFDEAAIQAEQDSKEYEAWCQEREREP